MIITKATGEKEEFDENKLRASIGRAGVPKALYDQAVDEIKSILYPNIPTSEIYDHILAYLGKSPNPEFRGRFSLKKAIMDLGPAGYAFEKFVAAVFKANGCETRTNVIAKGKCVKHEIDVVAVKDAVNNMIECKFHAQPGTRSDVKIALYVQARFEDLKTNFQKAWLVTNTKVTSDAIEYANCVGLNIVAWGYPQNGNLQQMVESKKLYPITCLQSLTPKQKQDYLEKGIVLCCDLKDNQEAQSLCQSYLPS